MKIDVLKKIFNDMINLFFLYLINIYMNTKAIFFAYTYSNY